MTEITKHIDPITGGLIVIDSIHDMIHEGRLYSYNTIVTLAAGVTMNMLLKNPALNWPHITAVHIAATSAPLISRCYESPITSADGVLVSAINNNRNKSDVTNLKLYTNPTVTGNGTQITTHLVTGAKQEGGMGTGFFNEYILKPSTDYLFTLNNASSQEATVQLSLQWYE